MKGFELFVEWLGITHYEDFLLLRKMLKIRLTVDFSMLNLHIKMPRVNTKSRKLLNVYKWLEGKKMELKEGREGLQLNQKKAES